MEKLRALLERRRLLAVLVLPVAIGAAALVGVWWFLPQASAAKAPTANELPALAAPSPGFEVQVSGAVVHPGIYFVPPGSRGWTALELAGGLAPNANPNELPNLAQVLKDGSIIKVPALSPSSRTTVPAAQKVNLNTATVAQLAAVPGFSAQFAEAVVEYRADAGGFTSVHQLESVLGMDPAAYAEAKAYLAL
ncbi:MAG: helix-hairpin-helix domain-containing protein [Candidatus Dormibacteraceae bacterium]